MARITGSVQSCSPEGRGVLITRTGPVRFELATPPSPPFWRGLVVTLSGRLSHGTLVDARQVATRHTVDSLDALFRRGLLTWDARSRTPRPLLDPSIGARLADALPHAKIAPDRLREAPIECAEALFRHTSPPLTPDEREMAKTAIAHWVRAAEADEDARRFTELLRLADKKRPSTHSPLGLQSQHLLHWMLRSEYETTSVYDLVRRDPWVVHRVPIPPTIDRDAADDLNTSLELGDTIARILAQRGEFPCQLPAIDDHDLRVHTALYLAVAHPTARGHDGAARPDPPRSTNGTPARRPDSTVIEEAAVLLGASPTDARVRRRLLNHLARLPRGVQLTHPRDGIQKLGDMLVVNAVAFPLFWAADAVLARLTQPRTPALRPLSDQDPPRWMDPDQRAAYQMALRHPLCVITGGPGSGKSRVAAAIAAAARASGARVHIAAPTGMAAHVAESHLQAVNGSGIPTSTVHRLIASAAHTADGLKIVGLDLLIIDESSMLDIVTFGRLCHRLPRDTRIVLVGDPLQLPAVGPGNILADLAGLGAYMAGKGLPSVSVPVARLTRNHRAAGTGGAAIAELARAIASGAPQSLWPFRGVRMIDVTGKTAVAAEAAVIREAKRLAASGTPPLVLTPFVGTARRLNEALRPLLNSTANRGAARLREPYDRGDRIVQIRNKGPLANGDLGKIIDVQPASGPAAVYVVEFDSGVVAHCHVDPAVTEPDDSPSPPHVVEHVGLITLAYALTVHKGQGSEAKSCIVYIPPEKNTGAGPEPTEASRHLSRRLLYTALTRAREELVVVAPRAVFEEALRTDGIPRRSRLLYRIRSLLAPHAASAAAAVPLRRFVSVPGAASGAALAPVRRVRPQKAALRRALARAARP